MPSACIYAHGTLIILAAQQSVAKATWEESRVIKKLVQAAGFGLAVAAMAL